MSETTGPMIPGGILFTTGDVAYEFIRHLGQGPHGERVFLARPRHPRTVGGWVVVKRLSRLDDRKALQRLEEEVRLASRLNHPNIARVHGLHAHRNTLHAVSEYVEGDSLREASSYPVMRGRFVSEAFALYVGAEVAAALHHAHTATDEEGRALAIVHRDINPERIRLSTQGGVKLTDFGLATSRLAGRVASSLPSVKGEVFFASPEQLLRRPVDHRSDLFALGLVLLELLTGQHLFWLTDVDLRELGTEMAALSPESMELLREAVQQQVERRGSESMTMQWEAQLALRARSFGPEDVEQAAHDVPAPTRTLLHRLLRNDPDERFQTGAELGAALKARLAELGQRYGAKEAAEEVLLAKAESRGIVLDTHEQYVGVQPGTVPMRNENGSTTSEA
ncbi:serine/threonine-protein kinase [Corallococcus llansteffanensis]|nr:serine/threonine-protein kinase [Corallococcus llansteffanensis]